MNLNKIGECGQIIFTVVSRVVREKEINYYAINWTHLFCIIVVVKRLMVAVFC